jgi:hypothetical protein
MDAAVGRERELAIRGWAASGDGRREVGRSVALPSLPITVRGQLSREGSSNYRGLAIRKDARFLSCIRSRNRRVVFEVRQTTRPLFLDGELQRDDSRRRTLLARKVDPFRHSRDAVSLTDLSLVTTHVFGLWRIVFQLCTPTPKNLPTSSRPSPLHAKRRL